MRLKPNRARSKHVIDHALLIQRQQMIGYSDRAQTPTQGLQYILLTAFVARENRRNYCGIGNVSEAVLKKPFVSAQVESKRLSVFLKDLFEIFQR